MMDARPSEYVHGLIKSIQVADVTKTECKYLLHLKDAYVAIAAAFVAAVVDALSAAARVA